MKTFYTPAHLEHAPKEEFEGGRLSPAVEVPARAERVKAEIERRKLGPIVAPGAFGDGPILAVHDGALVTFLAGAHARWRKRWPESEQAIPSTWPGRRLRDRRDGEIEAALGSWCFDAATPIVKGTWAAARAAVDVALSAAEAVHDGEHAAFALTRPPGHHAASDLFGGYCYLNNVAIAAQWFADKGLRPAILDVDYHHGNGTQAIFYRRADVLFTSIHADPSFAYPHFLGFADERGEGAGEEANVNYPLPMFTDWSGYAPALDAALARVKDFGADVLLVSLGLDTFENDPISRFKLRSADYLRMGERIAAHGLPALFVFEGGYDIDALAGITANVLEGFAQK